jgi:general secretion pathway protein L
MAPTFFNWWIEELSADLAQRFFTRPRKWRTLLVHGPGGLAVHAGKPGKHAEIGLLKPDDSQVEAQTLRAKAVRAGSGKPHEALLRLSAGDVLQHTLQIPKAAADVIEPVIRNQIERIAPWPEQDTRYGYKIIGPNAGLPDQLDVKVVATSADRLSRAMKEAERLGLKPDTVDFALPGDEGGSIELSHTGPSPKLKVAAVLRKLLIGLCVLSAIIGGIGLYRFFSARSEAAAAEVNIAGIRRQLASLRPGFAAADLVQQQSAWLIQHKTMDPSFVLLLEALSTALPADAYLTELQIRDREIRITGKARDAASVITAIEDSKKFKGTHFSAPTTRDPRSPLDNFVVSTTAPPGNDLK